MKSAALRGQTTWLGVVPVGVALVAGALLLPRSVPPREIPLPAVDGRVLERVDRADAQRVAQVKREPLSAEVRELGSAIRAFQTAQAHADDVAAIEARRTVDRLVFRLVDPAEPLLRLRAVQMDGFVREVRRYEASGKASPELDALGGTFLRNAQEVGWLREGSVALSDDELRVAFKMAWNGIVGVASRPDYALSLDETRLIYAFFLQHPHPSQAAAQRLASSRRAARTPEQCAALDEGARLAEDAWLLDKVERFAPLDPSYPGAYARGVLHYRLGHYDAAARAFEMQLDRTPNGPWAVRARNHLRAALASTDR